LEVDKTDKDVTLGRMEDMVATIMAEHPETQVIVFPELALEWYWDDAGGKEYQTAMAETVPGAATGTVSTIAAANNVAIAFGLTELDGADLYNTQVLIAADGTLTKYRKRILNLTDVDNGMSAGVAPGESGLVTADIGGVRVCLFICSDMQSAAITREIADSGVEVILHSLTSTTDLNPTVSYGGTVNVGYITGSSFLETRLSVGMSNPYALLPQLQLGYGNFILETLAGKPSGWYLGGFVRYWDYLNRYTAVNNQSVSGNLVLGHMWKKGRFMADFRVNQSLLVFSWSSLEYAIPALDVVLSPMPGLLPVLPSLSLSLGMRL
jgi:uncharacterized membrane protein